MQTNNVINKEKNIFQLRVNKYSNERFKKEEYSEFNFNNCLKSDNFEDLQFTNHVKSKEVKKYKLLLDICIELSKNSDVIDKKFEATEIEPSMNKRKLERLYEIIRRVSKEKVDCTNQILKFKNKQDKEIQIFVKKEEDSLKLYLIDLYHLYMEVPNFKTGRCDLSGIYKNHKNLQHCISSIAEIL